jgi:hypothetical protein
VRGRLWGEVVHDALDALLHRASAEVEQRTDAEVHQAQIRQQLLGVHGRVLLLRFHLDDQASFDEKVGAKGLLEVHAIVGEADR